MASATTTAETVTHAAEEINTAPNGTSAPTTKASRLASAACHGLVSASGFSPSSASACALSGSRSVSSFATWRARSALIPFASYRPASSASSSSGVSCNSRRSRASAARSVSRWVDTETYSPDAIDIAPATSPTNPDTTIEPRLSVAPATPNTIAAVETMPSLAPSTPARSQFSRLPRPAPCGSGWPAGKPVIGVGTAQSSPKGPGQVHLMDSNQGSEHQPAGGPDDHRGRQVGPVVVVAHVRSPSGPRDPPCAPARGQRPDGFTVRSASKPRTARCLPDLANRAWTLLNVRRRQPRWRSLLCRSRCHPSGKPRWVTVTTSPTRAPAAVK